MADPQPPSFIFNDMPLGDGASNEAMPRFGGRANPGEFVHFEIDGEDHVVQAGEAGLWDFSSPELANGDHEFEAWTQNAQGERSESVEWENSVNATENDRRWQRDRNEQWDQSGRAAWEADNSGLTPPTPISAGGGGQRPTTGGGGGGTGMSTMPGGGTPTPVSGVEKGNQPGARVMG
jgi:hypothetical protein